jgi:hypothetical protein
MALRWELQHSLCAAAGRATPGSSNTGSAWNGHDFQDKFCAYSAADNHVVTDRCGQESDGWSNQEFTHVSGGLGGGVGYMCAGSWVTDCGQHVRVEGTAAAEDMYSESCESDPSCDDETGRVTLNSGDAVFCSACQDDECGAHGQCNDGACTCEGNYVGEFCEHSCGDHGTSDGLTCTCESGFVGELCEVDTRGPPMVMRSDYNNATVEAVIYTGRSTTLSWELQHSLCAAAGRATPGSSATGTASTGRDYQTKYCAYSAADNHVVTDDCWWKDQEFTHVSGTLGGGVGWMCAGGDCVWQVRVEGTAAAGQNTYPNQATLNRGDAVFCSA